MLPTCNWMIGQCLQVPGQRPACAQHILGAFLLSFFLSFHRTDTQSTTCSTHGFHVRMWLLSPSMHPAFLTLATFSLSILPSFFPHSLAALVIGQSQIKHHCRFLFGAGS